MMERTKFNQDLKKLGKCTSECVICMTTAATVVLVPCNHLALCETCYTTMKLKKTNVNCPLCRNLARHRQDFHFQKEMKSNNP